MYIVPSLYLSYIYFSGLGCNIKFYERVWYQAYILLFRVRVKPQVFWTRMVPSLYLSYVYFSGFGWNIKFSEHVWYLAYIYHIFTFQGSGETSSFLNMYGTKLIFIIYLLFRVRVKHQVFWTCMVPFLYLSYIYFSGFGWNIEFSECVWYHAYIYHIFTFQGSGET